MIKAKKEIGEPKKGMQILTNESIYYKIIAQAR